MPCSPRASCRSSRRTRRRGQGQSVGIVICGDAFPPSLPLRARGWTVLHPGGQNVAFVGVGDAWQTLKRPGLADLLAALDGLVARTVPPPPVPCSAYTHRRQAEP